MLQNKYAEKWLLYFNRKPFGNCQVCNNQIRVSFEISKYLKINNYNNIKYPQVQWFNDIPICYKCYNLGGNDINEIIEKFNNIKQHYNYLADWYIMNGYCYHGNNKFKLCGNKNIYDDNLCEKHYNYLYEGGRIFKKAKFIR
jgi:hypothetical protein